MKHPAFVIGLTAGLLATGLAFFSSAGAEDRHLQDPPARVATAVFAGGCFWCVEADFDKVEGVIETVSGYTGGTVEKPTYKQVTRGDTGHYEAVKVTYDPSKVTYDELASYFIRHIDPTDAKGQFCDKGSSYRSAIFVSGQGERQSAETTLTDAGQQLGKKVATQILPAATFWPAEDYHQDYYIRSAVKYDFYRSACGRDARLEELWGKAGKGA
ncbi:peptide-methionine (S)-S-oxide reductase MsrA [Hyphomonas sp.]|uniref:peptide-methionine (S)-S-oxide reductase MsrA n=1 Tax=Hyphomonas sp. TaxID=87 RepID=UPI0039198EA3